MSMIRSALFSFAVFLIFALLLPGTSVARDTYFARDCITCHVSTERTCNGCHLHGTHPEITAVGTINLTAATDKAAYVEGDVIAVTLAGGNTADFKGWVGVRIYDASGMEVTRKQDQLGCAPYPTQFGNKCDLPMQLNVAAKLGWTKLYVSWAGNQFDRSGAAFGTLLGNTFGAGRRPLKDGNGNQVANHIEEIVETGTFAVTPAPPNPNPNPSPTPQPNPGPGEGSDNTSPNSTAQPTGGGGVFELWLMIGLLLARRASSKA